MEISYSCSLSFQSDLWNVYDECENFAVLKGHTGAIMELHFNIDGRYGRSIEFWIDSFLAYHP